MNRRVIVFCKFTAILARGVAKASSDLIGTGMNSALAGYDRPETRRSNHEQGEPRRKAGGGPHPLQLQLFGMTCG